VLARTVRSRNYTGRRFGIPSVHKAAAASIVVTGHVLAILAFGKLGPSLADAVTSAPLQIVLIPTAVAAVEPPEPVKLEPQRVDLEPPLVPIIELTVDTALPTSAITIAALPTPPADPVPIAGVPELVSDVEYLDPPRPGYPSASRRLREQGLVVLRVLVDERGRAERMNVYHSSGHARLDQAALDAVERAEFKPYVANGMARRVYVLVPIEFALGRGSNPHG